MSQASVVVLGLGNSILRDDAVGLLVADRVRDLLADDDSVDVVYNERGGMDVLDAITGYSRAVLIDAIKTGKVEPGSLLVLDPDRLPPTRRLSGLHDLDLPAALELAGTLGIERPAQIRILAVEIIDDLEFGEQCSGPVQRAIDPAARVVVALAKGLPEPDDVPLFFVE